MLTCLCTFPQDAHPHLVIKSSRRPKIPEGENYRFWVDTKHASITKHPHWTQLPGSPAAERSPHMRLTFHLADPSSDPTQLEGNAELPPLPCKLSACLHVLALSLLHALIWINTTLPSKPTGMSPSRQILAPTSPGLGTHPPVTQDSTQISKSAHPTAPRPCACLCPSLG